MDIEYLLLLQEFRTAIHDSLTPFMEAISLFSVTYLLIIPAFVYWCMDKKNGLFTLSAFSASVAINAVVKLTACVYRPWIRDARVLPAGNAIKTATNYSFPSGHTTTAVPIYGGLAKGTMKTMRWVSILCFIMILLTCFSRNYLGVHAPQDVLVGLVIGAGVLYALDRLFPYLEKNPDKENFFLLGGVVLGVAALFFITYKPYPMDYADGKLLVDPQKMMTGGYGDVGYLIAFCIARYIEKEYVKFKPTMSKANLVAGLVGAVITFFMIELLEDPLAKLFGAHFGCLFANAFIIFFIVAVWPAVMKKIVKE